MENENVRLELLINRDGQEVTGWKRVGIVLLSCGSALLGVFGVIFGIVTQVTLALVTWPLFRLFNRQSAIRRAGNTFHVGMDRQAFRKRASANA